MTTPPISTLGRALVLALAAWTAGPALAQSSPYYFGGSVAVTREANALRVASGQPETDDTSVTTSLLAGIDQRIGRQRINATVNLRDTRYSELKTFNHQGYGINGSWDLETIERLAFGVTVAAFQNLARFSPGDAPTVTERNVERNHSIGLTARLGLVTRLTAEAGVSYKQVDYSAAAFDYRELRQDTAHLGVRYRLSDQLALGGLVRRIDGKFPRFTRDTNTGAIVADEFVSDEIEANLAYTPGGASTFYARVSVVDTAHTQARQQQYDGLLGSVSWNWRPGGKLGLATTLTRQTGSQNTDFSLFNGFITGQTENARLITTARVAASYQVLPKVGLTLTLQHADRSLSDTLRNSLGQNSTATGSDRTTSAALGVRWTPTRSATVGCDYSTERRTVSGGLSLPYSAGSLGCYGQMILQ